ncbi:sensor domain-containing diguanylate cyclase [Nitrincola tapanii]|uniref:Diguanylate cyclase n=1 Tax=Nitrincola tapanii TaxID=1708751 RepID=A0A5A9W249_9GAMM|nr:sensor domain-containing diguanylate cyclase [Nitrincola tapanii]KAA0874165.1 diguanylate cyclase [Nitrincola tapanii]
MHSHLETELLYEIALEIGSHPNLEQMLHNTLAKMIRLLNCSGGMIMQARYPLNDEAAPAAQLPLVWLDPISLPRHFSQRCIREGHLDLKRLPNNLEQMAFLKEWLPLQLNLHDDTFYLYHLPNFGLLYLRKSNGVFSDRIQHSLTQLCEKLALAARASLANRDLRLAAEVFNQTGEAILITDANKIIQRSNHACYEMTGYSCGELSGQPLEQFFSHLFSEHKDIWSHVEQKSVWQGELIHHRKNGEVFPIWATLNRSPKQGDQIHRYILIFSDISDLKKTQKKIEYLATHDSLTGLINRNLFNDRLLLALANAKRDEQALALMFIDLDKFKEVNDQLGHDAGDALLIEVAQRLLRCVREVDSVSRMGGDEFNILLYPCDLPAAIQIAQRIRLQLEQPFQLQQREIRISGSIGLAFYPEHAEDAKTLMKVADMAMYQAKRQGRNQICHASSLFASPPSSDDEWTH